jgi:hypothetical protein
MLISKQPTNTEAKVVVECDFKASLKCKRRYSKIYKNVIKCQNNNDGKDCCIYCFNTINKTGKNNYNFKYNKNESFFENIDSEVKAYLLGWVAGDGHIKKDGLYVSINKNDSEIIDIFRYNISPDYKPIYSSRDNTITIKINSVKIVKDLCKHLKVNVGKKANIIVLPELPEKLLIAFIRGLFDSDGSVGKPWNKNKNPNCSYGSISYKIKLQIKEFCLTKNINCCMSKNQLHWWGANANSFMDMIYKDSLYFLTRKYKLYKEWSTWKSNLGTKNYPRKKRDKSTYNLSGLSWNTKKE